MTRGFSLNGFSISLPVLALLSGIFVLGGEKSAAADGFLSVIEDLPLMAGLTEIKGSALVFSTPQGRIAEVSAKGHAGDAALAKEVIAFYARTLPQLGWKAEGNSSWLREGERLRLAVISGKDALTAQFSLTPIHVPNNKDNTR